MSKKKKGFTLVELIVVIGILLVLAVLATVGYGSLSDQAKKAALRADAVTLTRAVNVFNSVSTHYKVGINEDGTAAVGENAAVDAGTVLDPFSQDAIDDLLSYEDDAIAGSFDFSVVEDLTDLTDTNPPYLGVADLVSTISVEPSSLDILLQTSSAGDNANEGGWVYWNGKTWSVKQGSLNPPVAAGDNDDED